VQVDLIVFAKTCSQRAQRQSQRPQVPWPLLAAGILARRDLPLQLGPRSTQEPQVIYVQQLSKVPSHTVK